MSAVIVTGMDMPKDCGTCMECKRLKAFCPVDGHLEPYLDKRRCPLKSIDGLLEKITQLHTQENEEGQDMYQAYDVLRMIREYCEVKE